MVNIEQHKHHEIEPLILNYEEISNLACLGLAREIDVRNSLDSNNIKDVMRVENFPTIEEYRFADEYIKEEFNHAVANLLFMSVVVGQRGLVVQCEGYSGGSTSDDFGWKEVLERKINVLRERELISEERDFSVTIENVPKNRSKSAA